MVRWIAAAAFAAAALLAGPARADVPVAEASGPRNAVYGVVGLAAPLGGAGLEAVRRFGSAFEVSAGLGAGITLGEPHTIWRLTLAGLAFVPAMAVLAGIAALAVAVRHPWIGWLAVTFVVTSLYLGALLRLPRWLIDASPVGRTTAPTDFPAVAMAVMVVVAVALTVAAGWIYRSRDAI